MVNPMIIILIIGIISAVFGALLIFVPEAILKAERQANRLFMTDAVFLKNRIPIGIGLLGVSAFLGYTYAGEPLNKIIFLKLLKFCIKQECFDVKCGFQIILSILIKIMSLG